MRSAIWKFQNWEKPSVMKRRRAGSKTLSVLPRQKFSSWIYMYKWSILLIHRLVCIHTIWTQCANSFQDIQHIQPTECNNNFTGFLSLSCQFLNTFALTCALPDVLICVYWHENDKSPSLYLLEKTHIHYSTLNIESLTHLNSLFWFWCCAWVKLFWEYFILTGSESNQVIGHRSCNAK